MKASEFIRKIQAEIEANGDNEIIVAANKHSYRDFLAVTRENNMVLSLFDKISD